MSSSTSRRLRPDASAAADLGPSFRADHVLAVAPLQDPHDDVLRDEH